MECGLGARVGIRGGGPGSLPADPAAIQSTVDMHFQSLAVNKQHKDNEQTMQNQRSVNTQADTRSTASRAQAKHLAVNKQHADNVKWIKQASSAFAAVRIEQTMSIQCRINARSSRAVIPLSGLGREVCLCLSRAACSGISFTLCNHTHAATAGTNVPYMRIKYVSHKRLAILNVCVYIWLCTHKCVLAVYSEI